MRTSLNAEGGGPRGLRRGENGHTLANYAQFEDLLARFLELDPEKRITAAEALEHRNAALARDVAALRQQFASRLAAVGTATTQLDGLLKAAEGLKTDTVWSIVQTVDGSATGSEANVPRKRASSEAGGLVGRGPSSAEANEVSTSFVVPGLAKQRRAE